jgi:hypothetical protein
MYAKYLIKYKYKILNWYNNINYRSTYVKKIIINIQSNVSIKFYEL